MTDKKDWKLMPPTLSEEMLKVIYPYHYFCSPGEELKDRYEKIFAMVQEQFAKEQ